MERKSPLPKRHSKKTIVLLVCGIVVILLAILLLLYNFLGKRDRSLGVVDGNILIDIPMNEVPEDALYITEKRRRFDGEMSLLIPAIDLDVPVGASTEPEGLEKMPGLYEFSQMPDEPDGNVSIAGHRDIYGMEFLHLDKLGQGDLLYLVYEGEIYRYRFRESKIVGPRDWSVIQRQGYTCLTLTTCDPVGTALRRLIVTAELQDIQPYDRFFPFEAAE